METDQQDRAGRRSSYSLDEKRRVLEHLRATGRVRETIQAFYPQLPAERYDARRRLVLSWRRNAREILEGAATRQGAARRRMRRPKTPKPRPPIPRGLAQDGELHEGPSVAEIDPGLDELEPIRTQDQILGPEPTTPDQITDPDGGIQDLIATAVEQAVARPIGEQDQEQDAADIAGQDAQAGPEPSMEQDGKSDSDKEQDMDIHAAVAKRASFSLDEKRRVLEDLAKTKNVRETINKFYPDLPPEEYNTRRRAIWRWRQCTEQIVAGCADDRASARKKMRPRGIVCHRGPRHVEPQDVVDRLLTTVKKSEQREVEKKGNKVLRPAPAARLLAERQIDSLVFSSLGLPPTTQFPLTPPEPTSSAAGEASATAGVPTMRPLQRGEAAFAIRRR
jgi:hypothetical protein